MKKYSFIDFGNRDFLRDDRDIVLIMLFPDFDAAEKWLLLNGENYGWTNQGIRYWCWDEEEFN